METWIDGQLDGCQMVVSFKVNTFVVADAVVVDRFWILKGGWILDLVVCLV